MVAKIVSIMNWSLNWSLTIAIKILAIKEINL